MNQHGVHISIRGERYYLEWFNYNPDTYQWDHTGVDLDAAGAIIMLSRLVFESEANRRIEERKAESDAIGQRVLKDMQDNPKKYVPENKDMNDGP